MCLQRVPMPHHDRAVVMVVAAAAARAAGVQPLALLFNGAATSLVHPGLGRLFLIPVAAEWIRICDLDTVLLHPHPHTLRGGLTRRLVPPSHCTFDGRAWACVTYDQLHVPHPRSWWRSSAPSSWRCSHTAWRPGPALATRWRACTRRAGGTWQAAGGVPGLTRGRRRGLVL